MKIIEFFFGWAIKSKYAISILDCFIFIIEFYTFIVIFERITNYIAKHRRNKEKKEK